MKKNVIQKNVVLTFLFGFILCLVLTACKNFLDAGKVKEEIEYAIYVNNHECPVASVEEPVFSDTGVSKNKAIIVSFSMPIDPATFYESYVIEDSSGNNLMENFMEPQWSNENKMVTIAANERNLVDMRGKKTMDIYFKLSKTCQTSDKLPIKNSINHKYRINDELDETPPTLSVDTYAERPEISFQENIISEAIKLKEGAVTTENEQTIFTTNHINSKVTFYIEGNDSGGDVKGFIVLKRINDVDGNDVSKKEIEKIFTVSNLSNLADSDLQGGTFTLDLSSIDDYKDGLYEVKVYVIDSAGTKSENCQLYYIIRDTSLEFLVSSRYVYEMPYFRDDLTPGFDNPPDKPNMIPDPEDPTKQIRYDVTYEVNMPNYEPTAEQIAADPNVHQRWYWGPESKEALEEHYLHPFNKQTPTVEKIQYFQKKIFFASISDDKFYKSYKEGMDDFNYFISWGLDIDHLTSPVKLTGHRESDPEKAEYPDYHLYYDLPQTFLDYISKNENKDVIFSITMLDSVGNQRTMYDLSPKKPEFYGYVVSDGENSTKDVKLDFSESIRSQISAYTPIQDKDITSTYRVFYKEAGKTELKRNTAVPNEKDIFDSLSDSNVLKGLKANTEYVVYIQTKYDLESLTNGMWCGATFSPLCEVHINTALSAGGVEQIMAPEFTVTKKESTGPNTGLFDITVKINQNVYKANNAYANQTGKEVKYIPCFKPDKVFNSDRVLEEGTWTYYEAQDGQTITFTVQNPLRAPMGLGEAWAEVADYNKSDDNEFWKDRFWDGPIGTDGYVHGEYTYVQAVKKCVEHFGYPDVEAYVKIIATDGTNSVECSSEDIEKVDFNENDDNIPPKISNDVSLHDGRLSYDGHSFEYESIITENEGHLAEYFNYYYTTYNPAWGDTLPEATSEIENLPGGIAKYTGSTWMDRRQGAMYSVPLSIPVNGLDDGEYMFYAKVYDTKGNYTYVTLGKANIGTFKNKLKVELVRTFADNPDPDTTLRHFKSTLKLEGDEQHFERNMVNLQEFSDYTDDYTGEKVEKWGNFYYDINALQECIYKDDAEGNCILYNYNVEQLDNSTFDSKGVYFLDDYDDENQQSIAPSSAGYPREKTVKNLYSGHWFRLTLQSFNENYIIPGVRDDGVDRIYGRPYNYIYVEDQDQYQIWTRDVLYYVDGETKYDVCTEETVSNTVYCYVPGEWWDEWDEYNDEGQFVQHHKEFRYEDLSDFKASFFASNARVTSNYDYLVNVIAASRDLGRDADEWERRGKLIATHRYEPRKDEPQESWYQVTDSNGKEPWDDGYIPTWRENGENDYHKDLERYQKVSPQVNPFDFNVAQQDMSESQEKGFVYYVAVVHFADGSSAVSDTYTMYGY